MVDEARTDTGVVNSPYDPPGREFLGANGEVIATLAPAPIVLPGEAPSLVRPATPRIRVLLADDDDLVRETLVDIVGQEDSLEIIGVAVNADEAIAMARIHRPDVVVLDVRMPLGGGPRAAREIRRRSPATRVVALSAMGDERSVDSMLASGATSFLTKDSTADEIVDAIQRAADGDASISQTITRHVVVGFGTRLERERDRAEQRDDKELSIRRLLVGGKGLTMVFQPIVALWSGKVVGVEALARFSSETPLTPDLWFAEADDLGLGTELQVTAVRRALPALNELPADVFLSLNVDPTAAASPMLEEALLDWPADRIVVELTEHGPTSDYPGLCEALARLRRSGVRVAIDDAGAGFASLRHILELAPDIIKLDLGITRDIDKERASRALTSALVGFAQEMGVEMIAEGVETIGAALTLHSLGVKLIQGFYVAPPGPLPDRRVLPLPGAQVASGPASVDRSAGTT